MSAIKWTCWIARVATCNSLLHGCKTISYCHILLGQQETVTPRDDVAGTHVIGQMYCVSHMYL